MSVPKVVYEDDLVRLWHGDGNYWMLGYAPQADAIITDPPYGDTSLDWDERIDGWQERAGGLASQLWSFGSLRFHMSQHAVFAEAGWKYAQEVVWEKHNGSGFHADRFKRVHELAVHYFRGEWGKLHHVVPTTPDATRRTVHRRQRPAHTGDIERGVYTSDQDGPRLMRSVQFVRSEHGRAVHPTQKPIGILRPLIEYSVPPGGIVLDPFAGSASTLIAAREIGRRAEGCELHLEHCRAAIARLSQHVFAV